MLRVVLAFSGGGTRAAALAYGALKELRATEVVIAGRLLRESGDFQKFLSKS